MNLKRHKQFIKDFNKVKLTDDQFTKFVSFADCLRSERILPPESRDHMLNGKYRDCREFHLGGDMLVIYLIGDNEIIFLRIGTHSQLFK